MAESKSFSISRKGYSCAEVDEYVAAAEASQAQLREAFANLQAKNDSLFEENGNLIKEKEQYKQECKVLAGIIKQLRENSDEVYKAKYEETVAQLEQLKADASSAQPVESISATQMIEEVAQVVRRIESDARRKSEALTAAARLEQTQAKLISTRVNDEVKSLIKLLEGFIADHIDIDETED
ncbi:MAG: hypothetical protein IIW48_07795 [Clostridia bacterium]|nr:hypothetical protein [Clostridia bacterium]